ncbi:MAG: radical SAM protein [Thermodesulfobacteriota bacterium]
MTRPVVLLFNPWIYDFAAYDLWSRPLGLLVLGARLRKLGWEPVLLDCLDSDHPSAGSVKMKPHGQGRFPKTQIAKPEPLKHVPRRYSRYGLDWEQVKNELRSLPEPRAIFVTSLMTYWYPAVHDAVRLLKEVFPDVPVFLGGVYATLLREHAQKFNPVDAIIPGPGESVLSRVLYEHTGLKPQSEMDTANLEFSPALDLMRTVRFLPLLTSRGCPFRCAYCASARLVDRYVRRPPDSVVAEIERAWLQYGVRDIALYDDAFLVDSHRRALPILRKVAQKIPGMRWHSPNGLHCSGIDAEVARAMKAAGFATIRLGFESSSDLFHERTGGKTSRQSFLAAVNHLQEAGFDARSIGAYLMVGLPGQTRGQIEEDVEFVLQAGAMPKLAEYSPIPGTTLWESALKHSPYPIDREPLFHNCSLLPTAAPDVEFAFLQRTRQRISEQVGMRVDGEPFTGE